MKHLLPALFAALLITGCTTTTPEHTVTQSSSSSLASSVQFSTPSVSDTDRKKIEEGATKGNANAQFQLGTLLYESGNADDLPKALSWFEKAAAQGEVRAMFNAGLMYQQGTGARKNIPKAMQYFESAAAKNDSRSAFNLGLLYYEGTYVSKDYVKARTYFEQAANSGLSAAALNVGVMYISGQGVTMDPIKAAAWFAVAKRTGHPQAVQYYTQVTSTMSDADRKKVEELEKTLGAGK
jgi:TPR repeat protein